MEILHGICQILMTYRIGSTLKIRVSNTIAVKLMNFWLILWPNFSISDEGIYNTYVIDTDYENWSLIMHCAEKKRNPRYLSALLMSRTPLLANNVKVFLREKLPKYNIDLNYLFELQHNDCNHNITTLKEFYEYQLTNSEANQNVKIINLPEL